MRRIANIILLFVLGTGIGWAQKANYSLYRAMRNLPSVTTTVDPHFIHGTDSFWYSMHTDAGERFYVVDPVKNRKTEVTDSARQASFRNGERPRFVLSELQKKYPYGTFSPDSSYIVYARNHNLYLLTVADSIEHQLTTDGELNYTYSTAEHDTVNNVQSIAHWFPDSKKMYILRYDNRKVRDGQLFSSLTTPPSAMSFKFALPGDEHVPQVELLVYDTETSLMTIIKANKWKDQYVGGVHTPRNSSRIYFYRKKRTCDEIDVCWADTKSGETHVLFNEVCKPFFNEDYFHLSFLNNEQDILWWSERTGWGHYYHYDGKGNLKNAISSGEWVAGHIVKTDTLKREMYIEAFGKVKSENPYYTHLCKVSLDRLNVRQLTAGNGNHKFYITPRRGYIIDNYSRVDAEPISLLRDPKGKQLMQLEKPTFDSLYARGWRMPVSFSVKAADGVTDLWGVMYKPFDLDPNKKYPIISHVYPGPQTENVEFNFSPGGGDMYLAQLGFIVITMGHRGGSPQRNKAYHTYGWGNLRDYPLADDKYGIEQLAERYAFIDTTRVGIYGHSGGGFMSATALCTYPDFYKAAVASAGNYDNHIFNLWWGETFHGLKTEVKTFTDSLGNVHEEEFYSFSVPTTMELANNLKGHLMLVTGDSDNIVNPANTIRLANALMMARKDFELVVLPGQTHNYTRFGNYYFDKKLQSHFIKYLLGDFTSDPFILAK